MFGTTHIFEMYNQCAQYERRPLKFIHGTANFFPIEFVLVFSPATAFCMGETLSASQKQHERTAVEQRVVVSVFVLRLYLQSTTNGERKAAKLCVSNECN